MHMFFTRPADSPTALISSLEGMRTPGKKRLNGKLEGTDAQRTAYANSLREVSPNRLLRWCLLKSPKEERADTQNPSFSPENFIAEMHNWSLLTMAVSARAKAEAQQDCRTLSICQHWINQQDICRLYTGMRVVFFAGSNCVAGFQAEMPRIRMFASGGVALPTSPLVCTASQSSGEKNNYL